MTPTKPKRQTCPECEDWMDEQFSGLTPQGVKVCDVCLGNYTYDCYLCHGFDYNQYEHSVLAVFESPGGPEGPQRKPGLYRVLGPPDARYGTRAVYINDALLHWVAPLPFVREHPNVPRMVPTAHLCRRCVDRYAPKIQTRPPTQPKL